MYYLKFKLLCRQIEQPDQRVIVLRKLIVINKMFFYVHPLATHCSPSSFKISLLNFKDNLNFNKQFLAIITYLDDKSPLKTKRSVTNLKI